MLKNTKRFNEIFESANRIKNGQQITSMTEIYNKCFCDGEEKIMNRIAEWAKTEHQQNGIYPPVLRTGTLRYFRRTTKILGGFQKQPAYECFIF